MFLSFFGEHNRSTCIVYAFSDGFHRHRLVSSKLNLSAQVYNSVNACVQNLFVSTFGENLS